MGWEERKGKCRKASIKGGGNGVQKFRRNGKEERKRKTGKKQEKETEWEGRKGKEDAEKI